MNGMNVIVRITRARRLMNRDWSCENIYYGIALTENDVQATEIQPRPHASRTLLKSKLNIQATWLRVTIV